MRNLHFDKVSNSNFMNLIQRFENNTSGFRPMHVLSIYSGDADQDVIRTDYEPFFDIFVDKSKIIKHLLKTNKIVPSVLIVAKDKCRVKYLEDKLSEFKVIALHQGLPVYKFNKLKKELKELDECSECITIVDVHSLNKLGPQRFYNSVILDANIYDYEVITIAIDSFIDDTDDLLDAEQLLVHFQDDNIPGDYGDVWRKNLFKRLGYTSKSIIFPFDD